MIAPPVFSDWASKEDWIIAVHDVTGVFQMEVRNAPTVEKANQIAKLHWPVYFTEEQQLAILVAFAARRMQR